MANEKVEKLEWDVIENAFPLPDDAREAILEAPVFGTRFTDHMITITWDKDRGWHSPRVEPYGPITMDPSAAVLHYGQEIFEGIKAYRHADGSIWTFRPKDNAARMQKSAHRMALPELPTEYFIDSLKQLIAVDAKWVPQPVNEKTLYIRPFEIAAESFLGVRAAHRAEYRVIASPVGPYFTGGLKPLKIWVALESTRAGKYGTGEAKTGGNYAASLLAQTEGYEQGCSQVLFLDAETQTFIEELGGMNLFFVYKDGHVATPSLTGTILRGITRDSIVQLIKDRGITIEERRITLEEVQQGVKDGQIVEIFACGTAAVITPVGQLLGPNDLKIGKADQEPGELTASLRKELTDIQYGKLEDRHRWMVKLSDGD